MPKYIYDNSPIKIGDVVEMQHDWSKFDQPIGTISIVQNIDHNNCPCIKDNRRDSSPYISSYFKKIKTKPGNLSKINDNVICKNKSYSSTFIYQQIYIINKIDTKIWRYLKGKELTHSPCLTFNLLVLCTENNKKETPQFTYPMTFQLKQSRLIIEFDKLTSGRVIQKDDKWSDNDHSDNFIPHTEPCWIPISIPTKEHSIEINKKENKMKFDTLKTGVTNTIKEAGASMVDETLEVGKITAGKIAYNNAKLILGPIIPKPKWYEKFLDRTGKRELTEMAIVYITLHMFRSKFDNIAVESVTRYINYKLQSKFVDKFEGIVNVNDLFKLGKK